MLNQRYILKNESIMNYRELLGLRSGYITGRRRANASANEILDTLYSTYYNNDKFSDVTSSYWVRSGKRAEVKKNGDQYSIRGGALGTFTNKRKKTIKGNIYNKLTILIYNFVLRRMIKSKPILKDYFGAPRLYWLPELDGPMNLMHRYLLLKHEAERRTSDCALEITKILDIYFNFNHVKHILSYDLIDSYGLFNTKDWICIIGDGHGFFATLIKRMIPDAKIIIINLGRSLLIDAYRFSQVFPYESAMLVRGEPTDIQMMQHNIFYMEAENYKLLNGLPISLFINIASMQEMNMNVIQKYFDLMRSSSVEPHFYCCNRVEKKLPDETVIRFFDYPWDGSEILVDELCPWYQVYPTSKPPFWRPFDGPIHHRLVKLNRKQFNRN